MIPMNAMIAAVTARSISSDVDMSLYATNSSKGTVFKTRHIETTGYRDRCLWTGRHDHFNQVWPRCYFISCVWISYIFEFFLVSSTTKIIQLILESWYLLGVVTAIYCIILFYLLNFKILADISFQILIIILYYYILL